VTPAIGATNTLFGNSYGRPNASLLPDAPMPPVM